MLIQAGKRYETATGTVYTIITSTAPGDRPVVGYTILADGSVTKRSWYANGRYGAPDKASTAYDLVDEVREAPKAKIPFFYAANISFSDDRLYLTPAFTSKRDLASHLTKISYRARAKSVYAFAAPIHVTDDVQGYLNSSSAEVVRKVA